MSTATLKESPRKFSLNEPGIALIAAALLMLPLWAPWQAELATTPHHEFFPILVFGMVFLVRHRLMSMDDPTATPGKPFLAGLLALASLPCLFVGYVMPQPALMCAGTVLAFSMVLYALGGWRLWRRVVPVFALLALITPPPAELDHLLTLKLQQLSVVIASRVLDMFKIFHVVNTNTLEVDGQRFLVEEACSGIQSLFSILAFALFYAIWNERGLFRTFLLLCGALIFDLSLNVFRICLGVVAKITGDINLLDGWPHEMLGIIVFVMGLGLTLSWDVVMEELSVSKLLPLAWLGKRFRRLKPGKSRSKSRSSASSRRESAEPSLAATSGGSFGPLKKASIGILAAWALLVVPMTALSALQLPRYLQGGPAIDDDTVTRALETRGEDRLKLLEELTRKSRSSFTPPAKIGDWTLLPEGTKSSERTMSFGSKSESFIYFNGLLTVQFSIDYPFYGFHDLNICYDVGGWQVNDLPIDTIGSTDELPYNASTMSRGIDQRAVMVYSAFLDNGEWRVSRPETFARIGTTSQSGETTSFVEIARNRLATRVDRFMNDLPVLARSAFFPDPKAQMTNSYTNYQIQALYIDTDTITDEKRKAVEAFFREAAPLLKDQFLIARAAAGEQPVAKTE